MGWKDAPLDESRPAWMDAPEVASSQWKQTVSSIARPVLEIGGAIGGGVLGAGATAATVAGVPVGGAAGGVLGMAAGKSAADALDTQLGLRDGITVGQVIPETAKNIQYGALGESVGIVGGAIAKPLVPLGLKAIHAVSPSAIKMPAILERFVNKAGVVAALDREQLSNVAVNYHKRLANQIKALDEKANATLSDKLDIPKSKIVALLERAKGKFVGSSGVDVTTEARTAIDTIDNAINKIKQINKIPDIQPGVVKLPYESSPGTGGLGKTLGGETAIPGRMGETETNISQRQLKDIVRQHENINWADPSREAKKTVRNGLDMILKSANPQYAKSMKPVADSIRLEKLVERKFGLKYDPSNGTYATDATAGKWNPKLLEGQKPESSAVLKSLDKTVGGDLTEKVRLTNIKEQFSGDRTTGSRMVMLGRTVGSVLGPAGSSIGAIAGAMMDKAGGQVTGAMIDTLRRSTQQAGMPLNDKTINVLLKTIYTMSRRQQYEKTK